MGGSAHMAHSTPTSQTTTASARAVAKGARPPGQVPHMEERQRQRPTTLEQTDIGPLLDYDGVAELLNCTPRLVRKLVETRQIDSIKVGRLVRVERAAVARYIEAQRRKAVS